MHASVEITDIKNRQVQGHLLVKRIQNDKVMLKASSETLRTGNCKMTFQFKFFFFSFQLNMKVL